jgi:hypothetical protein
MTPTYHRFEVVCALVALLFLGAALPTGAEAGEVCATGTSTATFVGSPLGDYKYCAEITWDTGAQQGGGLSHLDLLLGLDDCPCACDGFSFGADDTAGVSNGTTSAVAGDSCTVYYTATAMCGDPSVPGDEGLLVKFEYFNPPVCQPGRTGTGTFCFYSDWPPTPIATTSSIIIKFGRGECYGDLTGVLPGCSCEVNATATESWGRVKTLYR